MATSPFKNTSFEKTLLTDLLCTNPARTRTMVWRWSQNRSKDLSPDRRRRKK
jgi:hypothetical protein